jgi:glycine betaine/proline transport system substrate-binding protein
LASGYQQLTRAGQAMSHPRPFKTGKAAEFMLEKETGAEKPSANKVRKKLDNRETLQMKKFAFAAALAASTILSTAALAADPETCKTVRFGDVGWTDIQVATGAASVVLEALGYTPEVKTLTVALAFGALKSNDLDVFLGNWMPSQTAEIKPYADEKSIDVIGANLEGAGYGIVVPSYVADAGVKSLTDMGAHKDKFNGKFFGIEAGNDGNRIITEMIANPANKLEGFEVVESSEAGMLTEAEKAIKNNEWIAFLGWTPHPVMGDMKLHYLDGMGDSGFGGATVYSLSRVGYVGECPNAGKFFQNLKFTLAMEGAMMGPVLKDGMDPKESAKTWLKANPDAVKPWLEGVTTIDGGDAAAAVSAALAG